MWSKPFSCVRKPPQDKEWLPLSGPWSLRASKLCDTVDHEWMMSCGVSLFAHWGNTCTHHTSHHDHIRSYYSCHGNAGASPFRHAVCTTMLLLDPAYSQTMRSATLRALSLLPQLSPEQLLHPPPGGNVLAYDSHTVWLDVWPI